MFCPQCGITQKEDLKFCKSCGANLHAVRQAVTARDGDAKPEEKTDWKKSWITDIALIPEEIRRLKREQQTVFDAEEKRYKEMKAGIITSSVGLSLMIFLKIFMEGLVQGGSVPPEGAAILSRVWVAGLIPFFIGLGVLFNGLVVSKRLVELSKREIDQRERLKTLELAAKENDGNSLPAVEWYEPDSTIPSVTEHTTRELRESRTK
jgi:hypothetical protein